MTDLPGRESQVRGRVGAVNCAPRDRFARLIPGCNHNNVMLIVLVERDCGIQFWWSVVVFSGGGGGMQEAWRGVRL